MNGFTFYNATKIFFGENAVENLAGALKPYNRILFAYGGGSIKKNGIYDQILAILKAEKKNVFELSGIMANPRTEKVYEGIEICKRNDVDFILAVGGGSVIDCAKFIAAGAKTDRDFWQAFFLNHEDCYDALPVGSVLTLAGTGSEMDDGGVITHWESKQKLSYGHTLLMPKFSVLDPTYTYTLPKNQMINGMVDTLSHIFEVYFSAPDTSNVSDEIAEALMKCVIENLNTALENPADYTARANMMWCSTLAINGLISLGKQQDWMSHMIEHGLSAFYDIPHGAGLAVVHPNYLKLVYKNAPAKFARFARNVWGMAPDGRSDEELALAGIEKTRAYFKSIGAPTTLQEVGIPKEAILPIAESVVLYPTSYAPALSREDVIRILNFCLE